MVTVFKRHKIGFLLGLCTILFTALRLIQLDKTFLLHDERDIIFSGLSLARTGADLYGNVFPLSFEGINPHNPLISIWFSAIAWLVFPAQSVTFARIPFVLIGSALPILFYLLAVSATQNKRFSVIFAFVAAFNPWMFHLTRYAMDITTALPFILVAIIFLLQKRLIWGYVFLFLSFFNYQGFRVAIPLVLFVTECFLQSISRKKQPLIFALHAVFLALLFVSVMFVDKDVTMSRTNQIAFVNLDKFAPIVDEKRNATLAPLQISRLFDNKLTETYKYVIEGIVGITNLDLFFFRGDYSAVNGTGVGGLFFFTSLPIFLYGFLHLKNAPRTYILLTSFILIGVAPAMVSLVGHSYGIRGSLMVIGYATIITLGLERLLNGTFTKGNVKKGLFCILILSLSCEVVVFGYDYFFRRPIILGELYLEKERTLVTYLRKEQFNEKVVVFDNGPKDLLTSYLFLQQYPLSNVQKYMRLAQRGKYQVDNITFTICDPQWHSKLSSHTAVVSRDCLMDVEQNKFEAQKTPKLLLRNTPLAAYYIVKQDNLKR